MTIFKTFSIILLYVLSFTLKAQDTIVYKNFTKEVVILKEVSETEIKFKRFEMPDGPIFVTVKSDLIKIIFSNGNVENLLPPVGKEAIKVLEKPTITYRASKYNLKNLLLLVDKHPNNQETLKKQVYSIKRLKTSGVIALGTTAAFYGVTVGLLGLNGLLYIFDGKIDKDILIPLPFTFGLGLGGLACTLNLNKKLKKKRMSFVNLYNE